jgi:hypothetical protein
MWWAHDVLQNDKETGLWLWNETTDREGNLVTSASEYWVNQNQLDVYILSY